MEIDPTPEPTDYSTLQQKFEPFRTNSIRIVIETISEKMTVFYQCVTTRID